MTLDNQQTLKPAAGTGPRIYVACLAAYNNGYLHGRWIDADQDADDMRAEIAAMLKVSPIPGAEEWAIHDYEGFEGAELSEHTGIDRVAELAAFIAEHGELGGKLLNHFSGDVDQARSAFDDYAGRFASLADYAQALTEDTTDIPPTLVQYIDYEAMARDMELGGDVFTIALGFEDVHVFWSR